MLPLLLLTACTPASASPVTGTARAIDGDSLMVGQTEVRLFGIDAPEFSQSCMRAGQSWRCGAEAADRLALMVSGKQVRCTSMGIDQHGRTLGRCTVGGTDVNRVMVASGYATAYRHYSSDYVSAEESAKANRRGIWAGSFEKPSDYRHEKDEVRAPVAEKPVWVRRPKPARSSAAPASSGCVIKGNQGPHGWIYHVPGMPYYAQTRAEQMFCSEAEAQAAGYRRAKVR